MRLEFLEYYQSFTQLPSVDETWKNQNFQRQKATSVYLQDFSNDNGTSYISGWKQNDLLGLKFVIKKKQKTNQ